jgi:hypothetical protein
MLWLYQASGLCGLVRKSGLLRLLPEDLRNLEPTTPRVCRHFSEQLIAEIETLPTHRYRVGMLTGCVQDLVFSDVNRDTVEVLLANGCEVVTPRNQGCCGSLHAHNGDLEQAATQARRLIDQFDLASLDAMKGTEVRFLDIDDEYYRGIYDRVPQVTEDRAEIRRRNVLIDGDEHGYLLQIFTKNLIGPIFIEIIQRKNHAAFGEGNFGALFRSIEREQEKRGVFQDDDAGRAA